MRRTTYPQVDLSAKELMHHALVIGSPELLIADALRLMLKKRAHVLVFEEPRRVGAVALRTVRRAKDLGLEQAPVSAITWWGVPVVTGRTSEITVRRLLMGGAPLVLVREGRAVKGCVESLTEPRPRGVTLLGPRIDARCEPTVSTLLRSSGLAAEAMRVHLFAVGGFVRDLLLDRPVTDIDLTVEGDALALARMLVERQGGRMTAHEQFQTASIDGIVNGRVDVALARKESYRHPGALPTVSGAALEEDLMRRDFTVNAMAIVLNPVNFGLLMDPLGGWRDLTHRIIRVLHPLSFVEDPTRVFRAVRYAVRLGFGIEQSTLRLLRSALGANRYAHLSGQRLLAELALITREPEPATVLTRLGQLGAYRLLVPGYRFASQTAERFEGIQRLMLWANVVSYSFDYLELALAALIEPLNQEKAGQLLERLSVRGERAERLLRLRGPKEIGLSAGSPSKWVHSLKPLHPTALGWLWVRGTSSVRRKIEWFVTEGRNIHPLVTGDDLLALGVPAGPRVGEYLRRLGAARADGVIATREEEEHLVKSWLND